jgi:hypothetical protein
MPPLRRIPAREKWIETAARVGYGARGFVYLSVGVLIMLSAVDLIGESVGTRGALAWLAHQPTGRIWMLLIGLGLLSFVMWRTLQAVFDADHEGLSREGIGIRLGQAFSGMSYAALAVGAFGLLIHPPVAPAEEGVAASRARAVEVLSLPWGHWLLVAAGLVIFGIGAANIVKAWREDFTRYLACSPEICRRVAPLARAGHVARGLAYLPLAVLVVVAGLRSEASEVTSLGAALEAVERQPGGPWILILGAFGFVAFGGFSLIEARFRRIRPPRDLNPLP